MLLSDAQKKKQTTGRTLRRLAPGSLLMLAVIGSGPLPGGLAIGAVPFEHSLLVRAEPHDVADRAAGLDTRVRLMAHLHCAGLVLPGLAAPIPANPEPAAVIAVSSPDLAAALREPLRFVSRSVDPPAGRTTG